MPLIRFDLDEKVAESAYCPGDEHVANLPICGRCLAEGKKGEKREEKKARISCSLWGPLGPIDTSILSHGKPSLFVTEEHKYVSFMDIG